MNKNQKAPIDTLEKCIHAAEIARTMLDAGLPHSFILRILNIVGQGHHSAYELMDLWRDAGDDVHERNEAIADLQELIDDLDHNENKVTRPYLPFDQLKEIGQVVKAYKSKLRDIIDQHGGVSLIAERSGIPQPSLSRMLNSASMPRKTTLYKIAAALQLPIEDIMTDLSL